MVSSESIMKMLEYSYDGIWITDGSGIILYANSANAALLGLRKEALIGKSTQQLLDEHIFSDSVIMEVIKTRKQATRISHNERTDLTVLATATPIFGENGEIEYIFNNVRDITALNNLRDSLKDKDAIIQSQKKQLQEIRTRYGVNKVVTVSPGFSRAVEIAERVAKFDGGHRAHPGRIGHRQGAHCRHYCPQQPAAGRPLYQGQLRRDSREPVGVGAFRL